MFWVPTNFDIRVSCCVLVGAGDVWRPVAECFGAGTPNACFVRSITGRVHVVMRRGRVPVACAGHCDDGCAVHAGGNKHSLISRQNSLAEGHDAVGVVDRVHGSDAIGAVLPVWVRLGDLS